jgi:hypothetical protein
VTIRLKLECVADVTVPRLLTSLFVVSDVSGASPMDREWALDVDTVLSRARWKEALRNAAEKEKISNAPQIS